MLGLLKSGELRLRRTIDQGDLIKFLEEWHEKFVLITRKFFPDGTDESVWYGETLRDRSGRPGNIYSQEVAKLQNFVMGKEGPALQETEKDILFGECLWL